jgi:hypothetical protein
VAAALRLGEPVRPPALLVFSVVFMLGTVQRVPIGAIALIREFVAQLADIWQGSSPLGADPAPRPLGSPAYEHMFVRRHVSKRTWGPGQRSLSPAVLRGLSPPKDDAVELLPFASMFRDAVDSRESSVRGPLTANFTGRVLRGMFA